MASESGWIHGGWFQVAWRSEINDTTSDRWNSNRTLWCRFLPKVIFLYIYIYVYIHAYISHHTILYVVLLSYVNPSGITWTKTPGRTSSTRCRYTVQFNAARVDTLPVEPHDRGWAVYPSGLWLPVNFSLGAERDLGRDFKGRSWGQGPNEKRNKVPSFGMKNAAKWKMD